MGPFKTECSSINLATMGLYSVLNWVPHSIWQIKDSTLVQCSMVWGLEFQEGSLLLLSSLRAKAVVLWQ